MSLLAEVDRALLAVAYLYLATGHVDGFVDAATALGSRSWMPIVAMAEYAIGSGQRPTDRAVFDAADQPGFHQDFSLRVASSSDSEDRTGYAQYYS